MAHKASFAPDDLPPASLAELIELDEIVPQRVWREDELGPILAHELATPPWIELGPLRLSGMSPGGLGAKGIRLASVADLLHHPNPPLELLVRLKDFAKRHRHDASSHLPEPVSAVLYALASAAAMLRHGKMITTLGRDAISSHIRWALGRPWLDRASHGLLAQALDYLSSQGQ